MYALLFTELEIVNIFPSNFSNISMCTTSCAGHQIIPCSRWNPNLYTWMRNMTKKYDKLNRNMFYKACICVSVRYCEFACSDMHVLYMSIDGRVYMS